MEVKCQCFEDEEKYCGRSRATGVAVEVSQAFVESMCSLQMCRDSLDYCLVESIVLMIRTGYDQKYGEVRSRDEFLKFTKTLAAELIVTEERIMREVAIEEGRKAVKQ